MESDEEFEGEYYAQPQPPFWIRNAWPMAIVISVICVGLTIFIMMGNAGKESKQANVAVYQHIVQNGDVGLTSVNESGLLDLLSDEDQQALIAGVRLTRPNWPTAVRKPDAPEEYTKKVVNKKSLLSQHSALLKMRDAFDATQEVAKSFTGSEGQKNADKMGIRFETVVLPRYLEVLNQVNYLMTHEELITDERAPTLVDEIGAILEEWHGNLDALKKAKISRVFSDLYSEATRRANDDPKLSEVLKAVSVSARLGTGETYFADMEDNIAYLRDDVNRAKDEEDREIKQGRLDRAEATLLLAKEGYEELTQGFAKEFQTITDGYVDFVAAQARVEYEKDAKAYALYATALNESIEEFVDVQEKRREVAQKFATAAEVADDERVAKSLLGMHETISKVKSGIVVIEAEYKRFLEEDVGSAAILLALEGNTDSEKAKALISEDQLAAITEGMALSSPVLDAMNLRPVGDMEVFLSMVATPEDMKENHAGVAELNVQDALRNIDVESPEEAQKVLASVLECMTKLRYMTTADGIFTSDSEAINAMTLDALLRWYKSLDGSQGFNFRQARMKLDGNGEDEANQRLNEYNLLNTIIKAGGIEAFREESAQPGLEDQLARANALWEKLEALRADFAPKHEAYVAGAKERAAQAREEAISTLKTQREEVANKISEYLSGQKARLAAIRALAQAAEVSEDMRITTLIQQIERSIEEVEALQLPE